MVALSVKNLTYSYRTDMTRQKRTTLKDVSFDVNKGESFGFLGHNGAGKTTTLKCILGLNQATHGKIEIFGVDASLDSSRSTVGFLPEQPYFYDYLSINEILDFYATLLGLRGSDKSTEIERVLALVNMLERKNTRLRSLSKGLTQRVAMAQAMLGRPKLIILDEPFSGLDPLGRAEFKDLFFNLKKEGTTLLMSSHVLSDVEFLCDRASIMVQGEIKGIFNIKDIHESHASAYSLVVRGNKISVDAKTLGAEAVEIQDKTTKFIFKDTKAAQSGLAAALKNQLTIESFESNAPSLEEIFIKVVKQHREGGM